MVAAIPKQKDKLASLLESTSPPVPFNGNLVGYICFPLDLGKEVDARAVCYVLTRRLDKVGKINNTEDAILFGFDERSGRLIQASSYALSEAEKAHPNPESVVFQIHHSKQLGKYHPPFFQKILLVIDAEGVAHLTDLAAW